MKRLVLLLVVLLVACSKPSEPRVIDGAGATLPYPLYSRWAAEYARVDPSLRVNYQSIGSGGGIRQISDGVVDFGATDEPMNDEQLKRAPGVVHVPLTIGAVVLAYNVPGVKDLKLTPDVVADVFRGEVTRWDDARIKATNADVALPSEAISIVHRADGSGTSATFTAYLAKNSAAWKEEVGSGTSPRFPVGVGARGNDGVTAYVKATPFTLGYVELAYAREAGLPIALVKNRGGKYVPPTQAALDRAARSFLGRVPDDLRVSIVDADGEDAYPIAALSFVLLPRDARDAAKSEALGKFVWWALHDGQALAPALGYAPLPRELVVLAERALRQLTAARHPLALPGEGG